MECKCPICNSEDTTYDISCYNYSCTSCGNTFNNLDKALKMRNTNVRYLGPTPVLVSMEEMKCNN